MIVRAKFRCLNITHKYDGTIVANLAAVKRTGKDQENDSFWKYSPNGDCELYYFKECPILVGAYYYIDMEKVLEKNDPTNPDLWELQRRDENQSYVNVELAWNVWNVKRADYSKLPPVGMLSGRFKVGLSEEAEGAKAAYKPTMSMWSMAFIFAEPSDTP